MNPVKTERCNFVYLGPDKDVGDLHCERVRRGVIASYWKPDPEELHRLMEGGTVRVTIYTEPIPPLSVTAELVDGRETPFKLAEG